MFKENIVKYQSTILGSPGNFFEERGNEHLLEIKKEWKKRRVAIEILFDRIIIEHLQFLDYYDLMCILKKVLQTESNVLTVVLTLDYLRLLVECSGERLSPYVSSLIGILLLKFKQRNSVLLKAVHGALYALHALNVAAMIENIESALKNANPKVRAETSVLLRYIFEQDYSIRNSAYLQTIPSLMKLSTDKNPVVRKKSNGAIASAVDSYGIRAIKMLKSSDIKSEEKFNKSYSVFTAFKASFQSSPFYFQTVKFRNNVSSM